MNLLWDISVEYPHIMWNTLVSLLTVIFFFEMQLLTSSVKNCDPLT